MSDIKVDAEGLSSRRGFIQKGLTALAGTAVASFAAGKQAEYGEKNPMEVTNEPLEIQIRKVEQRGGQEGLRDERLRDLYTNLVCLWYAANHSFGAFQDLSSGQNAAQKMYSSIHFVQDKNDKRLEIIGKAAAIAFPGDSMYFDLTLPEYQKTYNTNSGVLITPLMFMRDYLVHELTHFITKVNREPDAMAVTIVTKSKPELRNLRNTFRSGFGMSFHSDDQKVEDIEYLEDFDEASTELIANYYQRTAGLAVGLPWYPDDDHTNTSQTRVEKTIDALEAILKLSGISIDQFALLHRNSDIDGLAKVFADSTTKTFQSDSEKVEYGLTVVDSLRNLDRRFLGEHIQAIKI
jgi:hypothetical protein